MDDVISVIICIFCTVGGAVASFIMSLIEHRKTQQDLDSIYSTFGSNIPTQPSVPKIPKTKHPKLTNCKNCGAVLHGNKCEFCDTEYDW